MRLSADELEKTWNDLACLLDTQPLEARRRYYRAIRTLVHGLVDTIGKAYSAESLLRFKLKDTPEFSDLLAIVRNASHQSVELVKDFAQHFDNPDDTGD